ncbi:hypothetical protein ACRRTK_001608 [Alexandromys fortis]
MCPRNCTMECLSRLLASCGTIKTVELQEKPDLAESPKEPTSKFFSPQASSGLSGSLCGVPEAKWSVSCLESEGPIAGFYREPPSEERDSQVDQ